MCANKFWNHYDSVGFAADIWAFGSHLYWGIQKNVIKFEIGISVTGIIWLLKLILFY